ncbi:MAG: hypothetical protein CMJ90_03370 [Planctomycetes bacterium]|nr:hypothetical protein [Planctomycetota bacterium]
MAKPTTVAEYLASLPKDRRDAVNALRKVIKANLDKGFKEGMQYGAIGYFVPHSLYPSGYHCDASQPLPFAGIASQKNHISLHLFCIYTSADEKERFVDAWKATDNKLDMGASCVRIKKIENVPLDVVGKTIKRIKLKKFIATYEAAWVKKKPAAKKTASKKMTTKKKATKKKKVVARKKT